MVENAVQHSMLLFVLERGAQEQCVWLFVDVHIHAGNPVRLFYKQIPLLAVWGEAGSMWGRKAGGFSWCAFLYYLVFRPWEQITY